MISTTEKQNTMATVRNSLHYFFHTAHEIEKDETVYRVFQALLDSTSSSGWALAKSIGSKPEDVQRGLETLVGHGVIGSDGKDLDAFYYVTAPGWEVRKFLSAK